MSRSRLKLEEGWTSFLLLMLMLLSVVWAVRAAEWTDGLGILQWIAIAAMSLGLALAKGRRVPGIVAHLLSLAVGAIGVTFMLSLIFSPPIVPAGLVKPTQGLLATVSIMYQQMLRWFLDPSATEAWLSNFMFIVTLAVLTWLLCYISTWFVFRSHWAWGAIVPAGATCLLNIYYAPPRLVPYFILYCLCALLLIVRMHVYIRQKIWRRAAVNYNIDVDFTFLRDGALVSLLALFLAWTIPVAAASPRLADFWENFQEPWHKVQTQWNRLFTSLNYQGQSSLVSFGRTMTLGGAVNLGNSPVFEVWASEPHYWRAVAYDTYTGNGWTNTDNATLELRPDHSVLNPVPYLKQKEFTHTVRMLESGEDLLFFAGQFVRSSLFARARLAPVSLSAGPQPTTLVVLGTPSLYMTPLQLSGRQEALDVSKLSAGQQATEVSMLYALRTLRRNQSYTIVSLVSNATVGQLHTAGTDYPDWVTKRYLQLPPHLPRRVRLLSREITQGASTPYDQAVAIQDYLRRITYDQYISAPPAGHDVVDWFLFENRRGYCDYYATAMAVMCRAIGIPARVSQGYTPGEYMPATRSYQVHQLDAHAWPEVYFPGYGWIEFEPTSSEPLISRPEEGQSSLLPGQGLLPGEARTEAEEKFGLDEGIVEEDIADITLVQRQPWHTRLLHLALALLAILVSLLLGLIGWWHFSLRGLSAAVSVYEQVSRLGGLLGVPHQVHQTPVEYGESLAHRLMQGQEDVRSVIALYVKQRFSRSGLSEAEEQELQRRWPKLRSLMWRRILTPRWRKRKLRTPAWIPSSSLRPPNSL